MGMPNVRNAKCPDCGQLWTVDAIDIVAETLSRPADSVARVIAGAGCRAVGQACETETETTEPIHWTRDDIRNIGTIVFGVDAFLSGPMPDEDSAFGLFD